MKYHGISALRRAVLVSALLFLSSSISCLHAQEGSDAGFRIIENSFSQFRFEYGVGDLDTTLTPSGILLRCTTSNGHSHAVGQALLPQYHRLVVLPQGAVPQIVIERSDSERFVLSHGLTVAPCRTTKDGTEIDGTVDQSPLVSIKELGIMRGQRLALLSVSPFVYNESTREVTACMHLTATVRFVGGNAADSEDIWRRMQSSTMTGGLAALPNRGSKDYPCDNDAFMSLCGYVVVAPTRFAQSLQPFVSWKRQQGFVVTEYYTDNGDRDEIRDYLQGLYDNATLYEPAPLYVLLVGNNSDIPAWPAQHRVATLQSHVTDLYYGEYTGDYLPDALVGRLPAADTAVLNVMIAKTIAYEQYRLADSGYLERSLLVAGKEVREPAPVVTNGQVNYLKNQIMRHDPDHDTVCFYNPGSDSLGGAVAEEMRLGVGLVNYTAHCTAAGWQHPSLTSALIDSMNSSGEMYVAVNNCCRANDISTDCFGAHLLAKVDGGAVAAIGATNETMWEEDFYWSVGCRDTLSLQPQYAPSALGAYDRLFHTHGELYGKQVLSVGQMVSAGNWAVTNSASPYAAFYWEIYCLLGDPSLMPYVGVPATQSLEYDTVVAGDFLLPLHGVPYAHVAATRGDTLLGTVVLDSNGNGVMTALAPLVDTIQLTVTSSFHAPLICKTIAVPSATARVVLADAELTNSVGGRIDRLTAADTALLTVTLRNMGSDTARNCRIVFAPADGTSASVSPFSVEPSLLPPGLDTVVTVTVVVKKDHPSAVAEFYACVHNADSMIENRVLRYDVAWPRLEVASMWLTCDGDYVSALQPNSHYTLAVELVNNGLGVAKDLGITMMCSRPGVGRPTTEYQHHASLEAGGRLVEDFTFNTGDSLSVVSLILAVAHRCDTVEYYRCYTPSATSEGFESGSLAHLPWLDNEWSVDSGISHSGSYSMRSGRVATGGDSSDMRLSLFVNSNDSIVFWVRTSCRVGVDRLLFLVDGVTVGSWYGEREWKRYSHLLTAGRHELRWSYTKNDSVRVGEDCAWVDDLILPLSCYETFTVGYDGTAPTLSVLSQLNPEMRSRVYPNPCGNLFNISISSANSVVTIYDSYGRVVDKLLNEKNGTIQYDASRLRCGIYHVAVDNDKNHEVIKLIIHR